MLKGSASLPVDPGLFHGSEVMDRNYSMTFDSYL